VKPALRLAGMAFGLVLLVLLSASLYTVEESQLALVVRLGAPVRVVAEPGLQWKVPFVDTVVSYDARLLTIEPPSEQVILGDQKRVVVQAYARYRIEDALRFNQSVRSLELATPQLREILSSALRRVLGQAQLPALLSPDRSRISERILAEVAEKAKPLGLTVSEVRFHRVDLPLETSQAIYDRMKSERQREAKELRAKGFEWAQEIQAKADRERTVILSEAQRQAKIARGEAEAEANTVLAKAFVRDPAFYRFYRSLQTYRQPLADSAPTLVLSPDSEFLRRFRSGPADGGR
jgi:modulator of FtsH protease HflC